MPPLKRALKQSRSDAALLAAGYAADFGGFEGQVWLNAAHQGPLPNVAVDALKKALDDRRSPHRITDESFLEVPHVLRTALARLIGADPHDIVLGNSASYGLAMLAGAFPWKRGDEVLFVQGEFPATVFPWRAVERRGVRLRFFEAAQGCCPEPEELAVHLKASTRFFCISWVNSFTGYTIDLRSIARVCRTAGVHLILNASQALGARVLDVARDDVDAVVCCGYKWLLGPYGTGFAWVSPALRQRLHPTQSYWLPNVWGQEGGLRNYAVRGDLGLRQYDLFATANFFNFAPWTAAINYLTAAGPQTVERYDDHLVRYLIGRLRPDLYELLSPTDPERRSTLVVIRPINGRSAESVHSALAQAGVHTSLREGAIRLAPHLYNTTDDIDRALTIMQR